MKLTSHPTTLVVQTPSRPEHPHLPTTLLCGALLIALAVPVPGLAQQAPVTPTFWHTADAGIVRTIGTAVFDRLGGTLSRAALDPVPRPWTIRIPDDAAEPWQKLRAHLYRALNARPRQASDTIGGVLSIESVRVHGDSLAATLPRPMSREFWEELQRRWPAHFPGLRGMIGLSPVGFSHDRRSAMVMVDHPGGTVYYLLGRRDGRWVVVRRAEVRTV